MSAIARNISVNARYDLQSPSVQIFYETITTINGSQSLSLVKDYYPNPLPTQPAKQFASLQFTVDLQGIVATVTTATLACDPIIPTDPDWWLGKHPELEPYDPSDPSDTSNQIASVSFDFTTLNRSPNPDQNPNGTPITDKGYQNELTTGQIAPWMNFAAQRLTFTVRASVIYRNGEIKPTTLTYQCVSTNATSGTYASQQISTLAEPVPIGLAQAIYNAISILQFEGSLVLQEADCSGSLLIGQLFNITGSANSEWNTMAAQVQEVEEDLDTGQTTIHFGPNKHLSAGELVDLLRVNRDRQSLSGYQMRASGQPSAQGGDVTLGQNTPEKNSAPATSPPNPAVIASTPDGTGPIIQHQSTGIDAVSTWSAPKQPSGTSAMGSVRISLIDAEDRDLFIQPLSICLNGVSGTIYFLCSEFEPDE